MSGNIRMIIIISVVLIAGMWLFDIGPFEKHYPSDNYYGGSYEPTFTGGLGCRECSCPGWAGSPSHGGECGRQISAYETCTHSYTEHRRAGD